MNKTIQEIITEGQKKRHENHVNAGKKTWEMNKDNDCRKGHRIIWIITNGNIQIFECQNCKLRFKKINNIQEQLR